MFLSLARCAYCVSLLAACCLAAPQDENGEGTRQLYYLATSPKEALPPVTSASMNNTAGTVKSEPAHIGLRYNMMLVDHDGHRWPIPAGKSFHRGDCVAIDLNANRSGYVYVFAKQSNNVWRPLIPSPEMPDETNILDPGKTLHIPRNHCFVIEDPPGEETLFVVLSRNLRDFYELYEGFKMRNEPSRTGGPSTEHLQLAEGPKLNAAVHDLDERFGNRNISIMKVDHPKDDREPVGSVYVVNTSNRPASSIVTKITIRHR